MWTRSMFLRMDRRDVRKSPRLLVFFAAVPGATIHGTSARPIAAGTYPAAATTPSASGLPERFNLPCMCRPSLTVTSFH
jgi:hypothetical protein